MPDLSGYTLTFDDEFNSFSSSANGSGTVWSTVRPGSQLNAVADIGFGDSAFVDPATGINPFSLQNGALRIEAAPTTPSELTGPAHWASGLISSQASFSQTFGYFEIRADIPSGAGSWPAFWLLPSNAAWPPELDVLETYGASPNALSSSVHTLQDGSYELTQVWSEQPGLTEGFHTFGVLWEPDHLTFYYDDAITGQVATPADMNTPMYLLADLAISAGVPGTTSDPRHLDVDYIRAFSADSAAVPVDLGTVSSPDRVDTSDLHGAAAANKEPTALDTLVLSVSGDSWNGAPQFTLSVDGHQIGGTYNVTASHVSGQWQTIEVRGQFGAGPHDVAINYVNDANSGAYYDAATNTFVNDRNIFVQSVELNGHDFGTSAVVGNTAAAGFDWLDRSAAVMAADGTVTFRTSADSATVPEQPTTPAAPTTPSAPATPNASVPTADAVQSGPDTLTFRVAGDSWQGAPQFTVSVDGHQVGGIYDVTAAHQSDEWQDITVQGSFGAGPHSVTLTYLNDANSGAYYDPAINTFVNDRNIFVQSIDLNGETYGRTAVTVNTAASGFDWLDRSAAVMAGNGIVTFETSSVSGAGTTSPAVNQSTPATSPEAPVGSGPDTLTLHIAGDSWQGAPQIAVSVDGQRVGGVYDVTALHGQGDWQDIVLHGTFGADAHDIAIAYLNDANSGAYYDANTNTFVNDRNVFVESIDLNGERVGVESVTSNTAASGFDWLDPHAAVGAANGVITFHVPDPFWG